MDENQTYRAATALTAFSILGMGVADAFANYFPFADPGTFFVTGATLLGSTLLKRKSDDE